MPTYGQINSTVRDAGNNILYGRPVVHIVANPAIASVDGSGRVTPLSVGSTTIETRAYNPDGSYVSDTTNLIVLAQIATIVVTPSNPTVYTDETKAFTATGYGFGGAVVSLVGRGLVWSVTDASKGSINAGGIFTPAGPVGGFEVRATAEGVVGATAVTVAVRPPTSLLRYVPGNSVAGLGGTFTRSSTATYYDAAGLRQTAAVDALRDAHYIGGVRHTLVERQAAQNYFTRSDDLTHADWGKSNITVTANSTSGPRGANTMAKIAEDGLGAGGVRVLYQSRTMPDGPVSHALDVKGGAGRDWIMVETFFQSTNTNVSSWFNLTTGAWGTVNHQRVGVIEGLNGGARRLLFSHDDGGSGGGVYIQVGPATADNVRSDGNTAGLGVYVDAIQMEAGMFPTSHIPTTSAAVIRSGDLLDFPWTEPAGNPFSLLVDTTEIGGRYTPEAATLGIGRTYPDASMRIANVTTDYATNYTPQGGAGEVNPSSGAYAALHARVEHVARMKAFALDSRQSVNGAAETGVLDQAHPGLPATWGTGGVRIGVDAGGTRLSPTALRKLIFMSGNRTLTEMRDN